jgi:demethylmenaquinone methyltransferase/2-methoxy-6-polyprenyl-1,4-benzoquinol methylase
MPLANLILPGCEMVEDKEDVVEMAADADSYAQALFVSNPLRDPVIRSAIQALQLPLGSRGLDAGCGIGLQAIPLAEAVGSAGHVTGLDLSPELLVYAKENVEKAGLAERITFKEGNLAELPFDDHTFDWAWSMDCVGYLPLDPLPLLLELLRVVKPGGLVAITAWSSEKLLPGHPQLEARLNATIPGIAPFAAGMKPESHFLRALGWFREAGLEEPEAQTFAGDAYAPLTDDLRRALASLFQMRWPGMKEELAREDWEEYQRLCLPESPDFILNRPDYYAFFTYSMFSGFVAG